jgi:hypothetical protein
MTPGRDGAPDPTSQGHPQIQSVLDGAQFTTERNGSGRKYDVRRPRHFTPVYGWWVVWSFPGKDGQDVHLRRPIVGVALRKDDKGHADWQFMVHTGPGFGFSFVRDAYAYWWHTWFYQDGQTRCSCAKPHLQASDHRWCTACAGEIR